MTTPGEAPILIVSAGRSGSTALHQLLSAHPSLAWFPARLCDRSSPRLGRARWALRGMSLPCLGPVLRRILPPGEVYRMWEDLAPGFSEPGRDLRGGDVTPAIAGRVRRAFEQVRPSARHRVLAKVTGWPRLRFMHAIFPEARFVHVARDPRAVVRSFLHVDWWRGWEGPEAWRWGPLTALQSALWEQHGRSTVALACLQLRIFWEALEEAGRAIPEAITQEVAYDELCRNPEDVVRRILDGIGLSWRPEMRRHVARSSWTSRDDKWRREFSEAEKKVLQTLLAPCLEQYDRLRRRTRARPRVNEVRSSDPPPAPAACRGP